MSFEDKSKITNIDSNPNYKQVKELQNSINNQILLSPFRNISQASSINGIIL
jgi:tRNA U34 5-carboxymethylaminomethyl modifying enzyme MnmG/GidA